MGNKAYRAITKKSTARGGPPEPEKAERQRPWQEPVNRKQRRARLKLQRSIKASTAEANREQSS